MVIEEYKPYIENMLHAEPWRGGPNASEAVCEGKVDWDGTHFWICKSCGRIGTTVTTIHKPASTPTRRFLNLLKRVRGA